MKIITVKNSNFLFVLLSIILFLASIFYIIASSKIYVSSAKAVNMLDYNEIDFGSTIEFKLGKSYDEYIAFNMSEYDTFEVTFINTIDDITNKMVVNSGEWATISSKSENTSVKSKPILHLIPSYIHTKGYDKITITPIRGEDDIYFIEDFTIVSKDDIKDYSKYNIIDFEIKQYEISIKDDGYQVILDDRADALDLGVLHTGDESLVSAKIKADGVNYNADIRLKGDWTDHLHGDQWSYRIELSGDYCIYGLQKFSLQPVATRNGIWEYLIYEMYRENGGVALRYDFADVYVDGVYLGVFAIEEFMEKRVIENSLNREGPIIKYNETQMWERWSFYNKLQAPYREYEVFSQKKTSGSENLDGYASYAITLMNKFIYQDEPVENVFDIDKYITLYSILDIFSSYHGRAEHNMRHYYNPVTARLEPIPFDEGSNIGNLDLINNTDIYSAEQFLIYDILTANPEYKALATKTLFDLAKNYGDFVKRYETQVDNFTKTIQRDDYNFTMDIWGVKPKLEQILSLEETTSPIIEIWEEDNIDSDDDDDDNTDVQEDSDNSNDSDTEEQDDIEKTVVRITNNNSSGIKIILAQTEDEDVLFKDVFVPQNSMVKISLEDVPKDINVIWETSYTEQVEEIIKIDFIKLQQS